MRITIDLDDEQAERLRVTAESAGMSEDGYLLTVIDAVTSDQPRSTNRLLAVLQTALHGTGNTAGSRALTDATARRQRAELLLFKEQVVEAVSRANRLQYICEQQQSLIAEAELRALTLLRDGDRDGALRSYQESCIYGLELKVANAELASAAGSAAELLQVLRRDEAKLRARSAKSQAPAVSPSGTVVPHPPLPVAEMDRRIVEMDAQISWSRQFEEWSASKVHQTAEVSQRSGE